MKSLSRTLASWPAAVQWGMLLLLSVLISVAWGTMRLPASLLLGPMLGGVIFGVNGLRLNVPRWPYLGAQGIIGAMVAMAITPAIVMTLGSHLLLFGTLMAATLVGATAVYGTSPGAASAMVLLGEAQGADTQLVAFMQYSRVVLVALAAALVAHFWAAGHAAPAPGVSGFAPVHWGILLLVLLLIAVGQQLARVLRLPAWPLLGPLLTLAMLHAGGWLSVGLPSWLLAASYALLGWHIGLGFRREALRHAGRALPVVVTAALCLMALCGALAWCLTPLAHVDALTAYLATSPGGMDSVAQAVRLLFVIGLAPVITRLVVRHSPHLRPSVA